jgi:hydrogenase expression/formation protein HypD
MKHLNEYREPEAVRRILSSIRTTATRPWRIMEVCGGQTHTIVRSGIDQLLLPEIDLIHGPGCPVCVTPLEQIDRAVAIASRPGVIFCSFGDMLRVPGSGADLLSTKAAGADVRAVYSPLDALEVARRHPDREVVFFAVGFETTAPANGLTVWRAAAEGVGNFSVLVSHVCVPPALDFLLTQPDVQIDAFLAAGHVCTVMGYEEYFPLVERFGRPIVVTGFETVDILLGVRRAVEQLEQDRAEVENEYARLVRREGNVHARALIDDVFESCDRAWRGIGVIPRSGYRLREAYAAFDAERRFDVAAIRPAESAECLSGLVLQGKLKPPECPAFGTRCTPDRPLGAPMVSTEGACAAYYRYAQPAAAHG